MLNMQEIADKEQRLKNLIKKEVGTKKWPRQLFNLKNKWKNITLEDENLWYHNIKESVPIVNFKWLVDITTSICFVF